MSGPARGRRWRARALRAALPCLALFAFECGLAQAQTLTPRSAAPGARRVCPAAGFAAAADQRQRQAPADAANDARLRDKDAPAPSRIGNIPTYGLAAASGASGTGFDSLNRTPQEAETLSGPGQTETAARSRQSGARAASAPRFRTAGAVVDPAVRSRQQDADGAGDGRHRGRPAAAQAAQDRRRSVRRGRRLCRRLPHQVRGRTVAAATTPIPAAPSFPAGSPFFVVAPEFLAVSDWERHALVADLRGSFTGYGNTFPPRGRRGVVGADQYRPAGFHRPRRRPSRCQPRYPPDLAGCGCASATDNPGSPNIQAGLARYPIYATLGGTFGIDQNFNRLQLSAGGTVDRTVYQISMLTDGEVTSNDDRNFNQYGGVGRVSYDLLPGLKPFGEIEGDSRVHDAAVRPVGFSARFQRRLCQSRHLLRILAAVDRRNLARLRRAELCRCQTEPAAGHAASAPRWCGPRRR